MSRLYVDCDPIEAHEPIALQRPALWILPASNRKIGHDPQYKLAPTESEYVNEGPCVLLGGHINFGHWVFEHLTRLAVIERFKDETMCLPIGIWDDVPKRFYNDLHATGFGRSIKLVKPGRFESALIPSDVVFRDKGSLFCWPDAVHWLRQKFPRSRGKRKIYAVRNSDKRRIINRDEVEDALRDLDFEFIKFAEHSFLEQIKIASEASIMVMPNGADAPITLFCDSDCAIIELNNQQLAGPFGIRLWALVNGCPYHRMVPVGHGEFRGIDTDFLVDTRGLIEAVKVMNG